MGVICNYNDKCGIASYAGAIVNGLKRYSDYEVSVHSIDTQLFKLTTSDQKHRVRAHFKKLAEETRHYDVVNIQFENGLFGGAASEVLANLKLLTSGKAHYVITLHSADFSEGYEDAGSWLQVLEASLSLNVAMAARMIYRKVSRTFMTRFIRLARKNRNLSIIVHTRRELDYFCRYIDSTRVFAHPLVFLELQRVNSVRRMGSNKALLAQHALPADAKVLVISGFISPYKGHLTAVRALRYLPDNFVLLISGSEHPESIKRHQECNEYQQALLAEIQGYAAELGEDPNNKIADPASRVTWNRKKALDNRVRFLGYLSDEDMLSLVANADVNVFPYLETGQTSSGPASIALELGAPMLVSNSGVFGELKRFAPNCFTQFDIGNYLEMASKAEEMTRADRSTSNSFNAKYNLEKNIDFYCNVFDRVSE